MTENSTRIFLRVKSPFHITRVKDVACHDGDTDGGDRSRRQVQLRRFHNTTSSKQIQYNMVWSGLLFKSLRNTFLCRRCYMETNVKYSSCNVVKNKLSPLKGVERHQNKKNNQGGVAQPVGR